MGLTNQDARNVGVTKPFGEGLYIVHSPNWDFTQAGVPIARVVLARIGLNSVERKWKRIEFDWTKQQALTQVRLYSEVRLDEKSNFIVLSIPLHKLSHSLP